MATDTLGSHVHEVEHPALHKCLLISVAGGSGLPADQLPLDCDASPSLESRLWQDDLDAILHREVSVVAQEDMHHSRPNLQEQADESKSGLFKPRCKL